MNNEYTKVTAAVLVKDGKTEYCYTEEDAAYYVEYLGYTLIGWEELYI